MSDRPDWELTYNNIYKLLYYVRDVNKPETFGLHWDSNRLHETIVKNELPDDRKRHKEWLDQRIHEDDALQKNHEKYYNPRIYNNGLPPCPYEIDVFLGWKYYGGDMAAEDITILPSDTYEMVVERVLKKFSWMIAYYLRQDWFCKQNRGYVYGIEKIKRVSRYKEWQERVRGKQLEQYVCR